MVVPSNRRGFLALLRNAAIAVGIGSTAVASPIQVSENSEGLPVITFDSRDKIIVPDGIVFDSAFDFTIIKPLKLSAGFFRGEMVGVRVWIPKTTPIQIMVNNTPDYLDCSYVAAWGEMVLVKTLNDNKDVWLELQCNQNSVTTRLARDFIRIDFGK